MSAHTSSKQQDNNKQIAYLMNHICKNNCSLFNISSAGCNENCCLTAGHIGQCFCKSPKKSHKVSSNIKKNKSNNLLRVLDNRLKLKEKHAKFCSAVELKMYQDEDVNKIHAIKTFDADKNCKYKSCNDLVGSLSKKRNTIKSNSTLIDIVNEISHNNSKI